MECDSAEQALVFMFGFPLKEACYCRVQAYLKARSTGTVWRFSPRAWKLEYCCVVMRWSETCIDVIGDEQRQVLVKTAQGAFTG